MISYLPHCLVKQIAGRWSRGGVPWTGIHNARSMGCVTSNTGRWDSSGEVICGRRLVWHTHTQAWIVSRYKGQTCCRALARTLWGVAGSLGVWVTEGTGLRGWFTPGYAWHIRTQSAPTTVKWNGWNSPVGTYMSDGPSIDLAEFTPLTHQLAYWRKYFWVRKRGNSLLKLSVFNFRLHKILATNVSS